MKNKIIDIVISTITTIIIVFVVMIISSCFKNGSKLDWAPVEVTSLVEHEDSVVPYGSIAIPGYEKLAMKAGHINQVVDFYNPAENKCYFRISLILEDGTELFSSGMIEPGQKIDEIEITRSLEAGTYKDTVLHYDCYALESLQPLNGSEAVLNLEVIP